MNDDALLDHLDAIYGNSSIFPTRAQWQQLLAYRDTSPITVVNLIKYRVAEAAYSTESGFSGSPMEALERYRQITVPIVEKMGVRVAYVGTNAFQIIGQIDIECDHVSVVEWPNGAAFVELHLNEEYCTHALPHRRAFTENHLMLINTP